MKAEPAAPERRDAPWPRRLLVTTVVAATVLRVFLTSPLVTVPARLDVDDTLFLRLSGHLAHGEWLGPYDETTLVKGPGYPLFLAGVRLLGIPRRVGEDALLVGACLLLLWALRRLGVGRLLSGAAYVLVLLSPAFSTDVATRSLRENVYGPQVVLVIALALLVLALRRTWARLLASGALGLVLGWVLITREEGVWLLPGLGLLFLAAYLRPGPAVPRARRLAMAVVLALPAGLLAGLPPAWVRAQNAAHYGADLVVEFEEPGFVAALDALNRVAAAEWQRWQPLDPEARRRLYDVSPRFAELRGFFESGAYAAAPEQTAANGGRKAGFRMWALRAAAAQRGHHASAEAARAFYAGLARELHAACDAGRVPAGRRRGTILPVFHHSLFGEVLDVSLRHIRTCALHDHGGAYFGMAPRTGDFTEEELVSHRQLCGEPLDPSPTAVDGFRYRLMQAVHLAYVRLGPPLLLLGGLALALLLWNARHGGGFWLALAGALLALVAVRALMVALVVTYWFPSGTNYLLCVFPLLPLAALLATHGALETTARRPAVAERLSSLRPVERRAAAATSAGLVLLAAALVAVDAGAGAFGRLNPGLPLQNHGRLVTPSAMIFLTGGRPVPSEGPGITVAGDGGRPRARLALLATTAVPGTLELDLGFEGAARGAPFAVEVVPLGGAPRRHAGRTAHDDGTPQRVRVPEAVRGLFEVEVTGPAGSRVVRIGRCVVAPGAPR